MLLVAQPASKTISADETAVPVLGEQPSLPEADLSIAGESAVVADWSQVSLSDFPALEGRNTEIENELTLGDLAIAIDIERLTFSSVLNQSKAHIEPPTLADYPFIADMQVADLVNIISGIESLPIRKLQPVYDLLKVTVETPVIPAEATLGEMLALYPNLGSVRFGYLTLEDYPVTAIPGFLNLPVISIPSWPQLKVAAVPGLKSVPLNDIGEGLNLSGSIVSVGIIDSQDGDKVVKLYEGNWRRVWSEENPLTPFGPLMEIVPVQIEKDSIKTGVYFNLCQVESCRKLGPFSYLSYEDRDPLFVGDLPISVETQEPLSMRREPVIQEAPSTDPEFSHQVLWKVFPAVTGILMLMGIAICLLLPKTRGRKQ